MQTFKKANSRQGGVVAESHFPRMLARTALIAAVSICVLQILDARYYRQETLDVSRPVPNENTTEAKVQQQSPENSSTLPTTANGSDELYSFVNNSVNKRSASNNSYGPPDAKESSSSKENTAGNVHDETYHTHEEDSALNVSQKGENRGNEEMVKDAVHQEPVHSLFSASELGKTSSYVEDSSLAKTGQTSYKSKTDTSYDPAAGSKNVSGVVNTPSSSEERRAISSAGKNYSSESLTTLKNNTTSFSSDDASNREVNYNETTIEGIITAPKRNTAPAFGDSNVTGTSKHRIVSHDQINVKLSDGLNKQEALQSMLIHSPRNNVTNDTDLSKHTDPTSADIKVGKTPAGKSNEKKLLTEVNDLDYSGKYSFPTNKNNSKKSPHKNNEKDTIPPYDNDASILDSEEYDTENETRMNKQSSIENSNGKKVVSEDDKFSLEKYPSLEKKMKLKDYSEENSEEKSSSEVSDNSAHKGNYSDSGNKTKLKKHGLVQDDDEENLSSEIDDDSDFNTMHPHKLKNVTSEKPISVDNSDGESQITDDFSLDAEYPGSKNKIKPTKDLSLENEDEEYLISEESNDYGMDNKFPDKVKKLNSEKQSSVKNHEKTGNTEPSSLETEYSESKNKTKLNKDSTAEDSDRESLSIVNNYSSELDTNRPSKENKVNSTKQSLIDSSEEEPEVTDASNLSDEYSDSEKNTKLTKDHSVENEDDEDLTVEGHDDSGLHTNYSKIGVEADVKKGSSAGKNSGKHSISQVTNNPSLNADYSVSENEVNLEKEDSTQANDEDNQSSEVNDSGFEKTYSNNSVINMSSENHTTGEDYNMENVAGKLNRTLSMDMHSNEDSESSYGGEETSTASTSPSNNLNSGSQDHNEVHISGHENKFFPENYNTANPRKPTFSNKVNTFHSTQPENAKNHPHFGHSGSGFPSNSLGRPNMFQQMPFMNQFQMFPMGNAPYFDNSFQMANRGSSFNMYNPMGFRSS